MHVLGELSWGLLTIVGVVAALVFVAIKFCGRALALLFGLAIVTLFASLLGWNSAVRVAPEGPPAAEVRLRRLVVSSEVSTLQMWEHLNRPRIVLDSEEKNSDQRPVVSVASESIAEQAKTKKAGEASQQEPVELSPPEHHRPGWVDNAPKRIGNVYRVVVASGPYKTEEECYQSLEPQLSHVVNQRIEQLMPSRLLPDEGPGAGLGSLGLGSPGLGSPDLGQLGLGLEYVWREICTEAWVETSSASFGEMKQVHVLMQFGAAQDQQIKQAFRDYQRTGRIATVGMIAGAVVAGLSLLYGLLTADTVTKGYYSKRLFFGVPAAIILIIVIAVS